MKNIFDDWEQNKIDYNEENKNEHLINFFNFLKSDHINFANKKTENDILSISSPITIFDGKWGTGKTYFISEFIYKFKEINEDNDNYFNNKTIYIDAIDLINNENILSSFLFEMLSKTYKLKKVGAEGLKTFSKIGINTVMNAISGTNLINQELPSKMEDIFEIENNSNKKLFGKPIIVFIDNLERIGSDSKQILKLLYKLRKVNNLVFVLVTNLEKLSKKENPNDLDEYPIYKFSNLPSYKFTQNYTSFFKSVGEKLHLEISNKEYETYNEIINLTKDGAIPSIRKIEKWIDKTDFFNIDTLIKKITKFLLLTDTNISSIINEIYAKKIRSFFDSFILLQNTFNSYRIPGVLLPKTNILYQKNYPKLNKLAENLQDFSFFNYSDPQINLNMLNEIQRTYTNETKKLKKSIKEIDLNLKNSEKAAEKNEKKISELRQKVNLLNEYNKAMISIESYEKDVFLMKNDPSKIKEKNTLLSSIKEANETYIKPNLEIIEENDEENFEKKIRVLKAEMSINNIKHRDLNVNKRNANQILKSINEEILKSKIGEFNQMVSIFLNTKKDLQLSNDNELNSDELNSTIRNKDYERFAKYIINEMIKNNS